MMNKELLLSKKAFISMRNCICLLSILYISFSLIAIIFGYVTFMDESFGIFDAIKNAFAILKFGKRPIMECILGTGFSVFYFFVIYKLIIKLTFCLKNTKKWFKSEEDDKDGRIITKQMMNYVNESLLLFLLLPSISTIISKQSLSNLSLICIIFSILMGIVLNALSTLLFNGKIVQSLANTINQGVILSALIIFAFTCPQIQILDFFDGISNFFFLYDYESAYRSTSSFIALYAIENIIIPVFNFIVFISLITANNKIINSEFSHKGQMEIKSQIIRNIIFIAFSVICVGYLNDYYNTEYLELIKENLPMIFVTAVLGLYSLSLEKKMPDRAYYPIEQEKTEQDIPMPENVEEENQE